MAKIISSERAKNNTRKQVLLHVEIISLRLAGQRKELIKYEKYAKMSPWAKLMIPRIKKTIRKTEKQLSRKNNKVAEYKRRGLI